MRRIPAPTSSTNRRRRGTPRRRRFAALVGAACAISTLLVIVAPAQPASAARYQGATEAGPTVWRDPSGLLYGAWLSGLTSGSEKLNLARTTSTGAKDTTFGTGGTLVVALDPPPFTCGSRSALTLNFTSTGTVLIGRYSWAEDCSRTPVVDTLSLAGARTSRVSVGGAQSNSTWLPSAAPGTGLALSTPGGSVTVIDGTGATVGSVPYGTGEFVVGTRATRVPGGPTYLYGQGFGGTLSVRRLAVDGFAALDQSFPCTSSIAGGPAPTVLPGPGTAFAVACMSTDRSTATVSFVGPTTWTRTLTNEIATLGPGYVNGDGTVFLTGGDCQDTCAGPPINGVFLKFGSTGALTVNDQANQQSDGPSQVIPVSGTQLAFTAYYEEAGAGTFVTDVSYASFGGGTPTPTVPGKPAKPTSVPGPAKVDLSWTAPADGGSPITGYRITPYKAGIVQTAVDVAVVTTKELTGLTNGSTYRFTVAAKNAVGFGPPSDLSDPVVPASVPGAPTNVVAAIAGRIASITWRAPASNGGSPITGYEVDLIANGVPIQVLTVGNSLSTTSPSLAIGTVFTFRVRARNAIGFGPNSGPSNPVTPPPVAFTSWNAMIDQQFVDLVGRAPTTSERTTWKNDLQPGTKPAGALPAALRTSADHTSNVDPVTRLYSAYLGRTPDGGGLRYWVGKKRTGSALAAISSSFATSNEFKAKYGSLTNRAFVELVYTNVLGRPGEPSGVTYWTAQLDKGARTRGAVMIGFSESGEYVRKQGDRVNVIVLHVFMLGRSPNATELTTDVAALGAGGTVTQLAQRILDSSAYATRIEAL